MGQCGRSELHLWSGLVEAVVRRIKGRRSICASAGQAADVLRMHAERNWLSSAG